MKALLIGVLAATLVGCSNSLLPQASMEACTGPNGFGGLNKMAANRPVDPAPTSSTTYSAAAKVKSTIAVRAEERLTAAVRDSRQPAEKTPTSTLIEAKVEPPASDRSAETSDPVIAKAKTTIAAKLKDPASVEFIEVKRAIRKNMVGQPVDTICGRVKVKIASDDEAGIRPCVYFVKGDAGFVVYGLGGSATATAYRSICSEPGTTESPLGSSATDRNVR
jgi:hypothetical protein